MFRVVQRDNGTQRVTTTSDSPKIQAKFCQRLCNLDGGCARSYPIGKLKNSSCESHEDPNHLLRSLKL
jgi:hypothetical protein